MVTIHDYLHKVDIQRKILYNYHNAKNSIIFMKGMFFMTNSPSNRELVSKHFGFLRIIQQETTTKMNVERVKEALNVSRTTAYRDKQELVQANVISEKLAINPNFATFLGISISYSEIEISVVGLDGKVIPWESILSQTKKNFENFNGRIKFSYSSFELVTLFTRIKEIIYELQLFFSLKAICIAFDEADLKKETFSLKDYFTEYGATAYSFNDFCTICFNEILGEIPFFLERNAVCQLVAKEFPMLKREHNSLYISIEQNGCFAAMIFCNVVHCGYNMQTLNLSELLDEKEKKSLLSNDVSDNDLLLICMKIFKSVVIPLTPEQIYINGKAIPQDNKFLNLLSFQRSVIFGKLCMARDYSPSIKLITNSESKGAAIMAMYRYYGWDYTCI